MSGETVQRENVESVARRACVRLWPCAGHDRDDMHQMIIMFLLQHYVGYPVGSAIRYARLWWIRDVFQRDAKRPTMVSIHRHNDSGEQWQIEPADTRHSEDDAVAEDQEALQQAVARLKPLFRDPMLLQAMGLTVRQIGRVLNITHQGVAWRLARARERVRELMAMDRMPPAEDQEMPYFALPIGAGERLSEGRLYEFHYGPGCALA